MGLKDTVKLVFFFPKNASKIDLGRKENTLRLHFFYKIMEARAPISIVLYVPGWRVNSFGTYTVNSARNVCKINN